MWWGMVMTHRGYIGVDRPSMVTAAQVIPTGSTDNSLFSSGHVSPYHTLVEFSAANP